MLADTCDIVVVSFHGGLKVLNFRMFPEKMKFSMVKTGEMFINLLTL